jgi:E3 ubiquitin-protein ligase RAD18
MEAPNGQDTDPSDFTDTLVPGLQDLDNVIRCGICKNYMKDAMVTSCSHTYCAKCIRAAITANGKCPLCSKTIQTSTLRFNWPIREVVGHWSKARADVLSLVSQRDNSKIPDLHDPQLIQDAAILRKRGIAEVENATESPRYKTRSRRDPEATSSATPASRENNVSIDHADDEKDGDYSEEEASNITPAQAAQAAKAIMVSCPICSERMLESAVFSHLDHCMGPERATQIANAKSQSKR